MKYIKIINHIIAFVNDKNVLMRLFFYIERNFKDLLLIIHLKCSTIIEGFGSTLKLPLFVV